VKNLKIERFRCLDLGKAQFCIQVCTFEDVLIDDVDIRGRKDGIHFGKGKQVFLKTSDNLITGHDFSADVEQGNGKITVQSDLIGLRKK
jgi:hypothetical protein